MTIYICKGCGRETNSVCCQFVHQFNEMPNYCFAAREDGKWVKGCGFDKADAFGKAFTMHLITGESTESFLQNYFKKKVKLIKEAYKKTSNSKLHFP